MTNKLAQVGQFCANEACELYGDIETAQIIRFGRTKNGTQRYQCKNCGQTFAEAHGTMFYRRQASRETILETLNPSMEVAPEEVLDRMTYHHPIYSVKAIDAQRRYSEINGQRGTYYCGAYWGYGFHEDGVRSALAVAECFGKSLESCIAAST